MPEQEAKSLVEVPYGLEHVKEAVRHRGCWAVIVSKHGDEVDRVGSLDGYPPVAI